MKILAIETSCDETAVAVLECEGVEASTSFKILGNSLYSQAEKHAEYGGVYPTLAKREHQTNLAPLTARALEEAGLLVKDGVTAIPDNAFANVQDPPFRQAITDFLEAYEKPDIDLIAVTRGPGLEPALWTGINFATALSRTWNVPLMGIDHMEGHIMSALLEPAGTNSFTFRNPELPLLALLISGGHTEFMLMKKWFSYERIGETKDDAVGEAFDKVARLLGLAYPGGPKIAEFAAKSRERGENTLVFPRPMADDNTCDLSFSGLKTAVLYKMRGMNEISESEKEHVAEAFENAARDVLALKAKRALERTGAKTFAVGGGVSANAEIRRALTELVSEDFSNVALHFPDNSLTGDNAVMIGAAAYLRSVSGKETHVELTASGSQRLFN